VKILGVTVKVICLALCLVLIWFLSGEHEAAFRYMGF
tara:strand:- start:10 stop:120 length:111 start_codon:yes stop_codon:yes gene_type:complete